MPPTRVVVLERAASYRRGIQSALSESGHTVTEDLSTASLALVTLSDDDDCAAMTEMVEKGVAVVALLPTTAISDFAHAFAHGAAAAVAWDADPVEIVRAVEAASAGWSLTPLGVLQSLASEWPSAHGPTPNLTEREVAWLAALAAGHTVTRIADDAGYSERAMFRRLHDMYSRLGAGSRAEAIVTAERLGLLP